MALSMNSVVIPWDFGATPDFREKLGFGVVSGDLGGQKAFPQIAWPRDSRLSGAMPQETFSQSFSRLHARRARETFLNRGWVPNSWLCAKSSGGGVLR